ncbi:MAG: recombinase family protein [Rhodospirillales bacterium]|nr:recombinase family protein [Rhodospirillales bacterium]
MTVGYARLSAADQDPARQIQALRERGCERIFTDHFRGRKGIRPQLAAALNSLGKNGTLVVWRLDRLARSLRHLVALAGELERRQCRLVSLSEPIDTGARDGGTVFAVFGAMARCEVDLRRERTADAHRVARATGRRLGRPSPFHDSANVRAAQSLLADPTVPAAEVARRFGVSRNALYRWFPGGAPDAFTGSLEGGPA